MCVALLQCRKPNDELAYASSFLPTDFTPTKYSAKSKKSSSIKNKERYKHYSSVSMPTVAPASSTESTMTTIVANPNAGVYAMYNPATETLQVTESLNDTAVVSVQIPDTASVSYNEVTEMLEISALPRPPPPATNETTVPITNVPATASGQNQPESSAALPPGTTPTPAATIINGSVPQPGGTGAPAVIGIPERPTLDAPPAIDSPPNTDGSARFDTLVPTLMVVAPSSSATIPSAPAVPTPATEAPVAPSTRNPTPVPVLQIAEVPLDTRSLVSDPVYLRITGYFDPSTEEAVFFDVLQENFEPYGRAYIGSDPLKDIVMHVEFFPELSLPAVQQRQRTSDTLVSSWAEIIVTFHLSMEESNLDREGVSQIVRRFFVASHKERLVSRLEEAGIEISTMLVFDDIPEAIQAIRGPGDYVEGTDDYYSNSVAPSFDGDSDNAPHTSNRPSAIVAAILSGGIILLALGCVILSNRRRQQQQRYVRPPKGPNEAGFLHISSSSSSSSSNGNSQHLAGFTSGADDAMHTDDDDDDNNANAIYTPNRNEQREPYFNNVASCNSTVSSYPSHLIYPGDGGTPTSDQPSNSLTPDGSPVEERALMLLDESPGLVAASTLVNSNRAPYSPERTVLPDLLDDYGDTVAAPSPIWSNDNLSNGTPYSSSNLEEQQVDSRRRWHELSSDVDSIGIPDHYSEQERDGSVDGGNNSLQQQDEDTGDADVSVRGIV